LEEAISLKFPDQEKMSVQDQALAIKNRSYFYREKQGIKGLPPVSPAPQIPAEAPPLRSGKLSPLRIVVDEPEHFPSQSACQRRFAPTAVRLQRNTVRLPAGISVHLHRNPHQPPKAGACSDYTLLCPVCLP